jgi:hypothetical protein
LVIVQLKVLSGRQAGAVFAARRFPVRVGRAGGADVRFEEAGVWDRHFELEFRPPEGIQLRAAPEALVQLNHQAVAEAWLRNGDLIELGALKLQFWLGETRQSGLRAREALIWTGIATICLGQVGLIYWLLR